MITKILPVLAPAEPGKRMDAGSSPYAGEARESARYHDGQRPKSVPATAALRGNSRGEQIHLRSIMGKTVRAYRAELRRQEHEDAELDAWLATLPRKMRFLLGMAASAMSLERGQCRSRGDLLCFLAAAGLPTSRQAIENIERSALRKCRRGSLAILAKEHLTIR